MYFSSWYKFSCSFGNILFLVDEALLMLMGSSFLHYYICLFYNYPLQEVLVSNFLVTIRNIFIFQKENYG